MGADLSYEGEFKKDKPDGIGRILYKNGLVTFDGHFKKGMKEGAG